VFLISTIPIEPHSDQLRVPWGPFMGLAYSGILFPRAVKPFSIVCQFPAFPRESMPIGILFPRSQTGLLVGLLVDPMVQEKVCQEFEVNLFLAYFFRATAYVGSIDSYVDDMGH